MEQHSLVVGECLGMGKQHVLFSVIFADFLFKLFRLEGRAPGVITLIIEVISPICKWQAGVHLG